MELPDEFSIASNGAADFSFGAPGEDELSSFDAELATMLSRATANIGLEWNPLPCPEGSRMICLGSFSSSLMAKAYSAAGQAASALHAKAILQVYQANTLKDLL